MQEYDVIPLSGIAGVGLDLEPVASEQFKVRNNGKTFVLFRPAAESTCQASVFNRRTNAWETWLNVSTDIIWGPFKRETYNDHRDYMHVKFTIPAENNVTYGLFSL